MIMKIYSLNPVESLDGRLKFDGGIRFSAGQNSYILNRDTGTSIILSDSLADGISQGKISEALWVKLIQRGLARTPDGLKCQCSERVLPTFFIFDLTQACNFRCIYCFRQLEYEVKTISYDNLNAIIDYIIAYCAQNGIKDFCIQPWGGEPLIAFDRIRHLVNRFSEANLHPLVSIETNGSLITQELAEECQRLNIRLGISIDGHELVQNMHRPLASGKPSFRKMMDGVGILKRYVGPGGFGVVSVLTARSLPYLEEIIEFLAQEVQVRCFKLNLIKDNPVMKASGLCLTEADVADAQTRLLKKLLELNARGFSITELNVQEKLMNLLVRAKSNICTSRGCMGGTKMIAFDQDGRIFPCDVTDYKEEAIGSVHDRQDLIKLVLESKESRDFFNRKHSEECDDCPFWPFCKGGCTTAIKYKLGKVEGIDHQECAANKALYPALIDLILTDPDSIRELTRNRVKLHKS